MCVKFPCLFFKLKGPELRSFSKLEFRNSVSMHAHLHGKFIEEYKYIVYSSYVLTCKIWMTVLLANNLFFSDFNKLFMRSDSRSCSLRVHRFTFQLRDCISVGNVNKPWPICFIANLIAISKGCTNGEAFNTERPLRCYPLGWKIFMTWSPAVYIQ